MTEQGEPYAHLTPEERFARSAAIKAARASIRAGDHVAVEEIRGWVESWDTPNERPMPQPRKR